MNVAAYALYRSGSAATQALTGSPNGADDTFSKVFGSAMRGFMSKGGIQEALDSLRERFPSLKINEGEVEPGLEGVKKQYEKEDPATDQATVSSSVLAGMFGNSELAKMVENALAGFLERGDNNNLMNIQGAVVQRTVTITYTQVRYGEFHRSEETGETLAASELKANFHERLAELIQKFFGAANGEAASDTEDADSDASDETKKSEAAAETGKTGNLPASGASISMWSLEVYYSFSYIGGTASQGSQGASANGMQASWQSASWQYSSFSGSLRGITGNFLPEAFQNALGGKGSGNGNLLEFLEETLASFGLVGGSLRESQEGMFLKLREGRNLIAELMELYGGRINPKPAEVVSQEDAVAEAEEGSGAEAVAEAAAAVE